MKDLSKAEVLAKTTKRRKHEYKYRPGSFALTASFRDTTIGQVKVALVGALVQHLTQRQMATVLGVSVSTLSKLIRIHTFQQRGQ